MYTSKSWKTRSSTIFLDEIDKEQTRLIIRLRANDKPGLWTTLFYLIFEPGDFLMMRKQLLGIKRRADAQHKSTSAT
jgi:hypothetical protein